MHRPLARRAERARGRILALAALAALALGGAPPAAAYSYAAAGSEPLIEAREQTLAALNAGDFAAAAQASQKATAELTYLDEHQRAGLRAALAKALAARDERAIDRVFLQAFAAETRRRLEAAGQNLADYQVAKTLVVRAKLFLDLLAPHLAEAARASAQANLESCLEAIGNPGVFGVGAREADPAAFRSHAARVVESLAAL